MAQLLSGRKFDWSWVFFNAVELQRPWDVY